MTLTPKLKSQIYKAITEKDTPLFASCMEALEKIIPGFELTTIQLIIDDKEGNMYIADFVKLVTKHDAFPPDFPPDHYHTIWCFWISREELKFGLVSNFWEKAENNEKEINLALEDEDEY